MVLADMLEALGLDRNDRQAHRLHDELRRSAGQAPPDWRILASGLACSVTPRRAAERTAPGIRWPRWDEVRPPLVLGIGGGQGSGKTTLARLLCQALTSAGARAAACSIDDFYLSHAERLALARSVHPLLATRGVPGTHDVASLRYVVALLGRPGAVRLPVFDKGADDVSPSSQWRCVDAPVQVLVLEGWCLGAAPEPDAALAEAVNDLEAREDPDGTWRRWVNAALRGAYADLWKCIHVLVYLQVPDMEAVIRWRSEQERGLPPAARMAEARLRRFVAHYERITRAMQTDLPAHADLVVELNDHHRVAAMWRNEG